MMKKLLTILVAMVLGTSVATAQRATDKLDRGVVAVPASSGTGYLVSWRIFGEEYYDTQYNIYRNGTKLNTSPLRVSNYLDTGGSAASTYQVAAVVNGVEQALSVAVTPWTNGYLRVPVQAVTDRNGNDVTSHYSINDISLGDVTGDGVSEFILKRNCDISHDVNNDSAFALLECYDADGNRLWWIDLGPNMLSGADEQYDIVFFDWDGDGKAEGLLRGADNMMIHTDTGATINIGDMSVDTRWSGIEYTSTGNEYLIYLDGETGTPYEIGPSEHPLYMDYPLTRGQDSDWGTGIVGHRSTKHFFGAPFLDGRKASIFLGRGAYTKHKMAAYDVDPATHQLTQRWYWTSDGLATSWFGQGYHNFAIADVDMDGRDEIVFGSMVIDDNGKGLSTTGLGHGDAQHVGDFDPYRKGLEQFACNESSPNMNYRNATTSVLYYRSQGSSDDGRALMGNFSNDFPGCLGRSVNTGLISSVADRLVDGGPSTSGTNDALYWSHLNFRIYWDGDLCDEVFDSPGTAREGVVYKPGGGRIFQSSGCHLNNSSKNNPCAQGDIYGDWREEIVIPESGEGAFRIYTTPIETSWRNYTLWHDHQYRNAMVWQSIGYNQPPHVSYFLGEMEGITVAPPPLTLTGRTEIANGGTISTATDGQQIIVCETNDTKISVSEGASPSVATFNVPSWTQGSNNNSGITTTTYACTVSGGAFSGSTRVVKQGEGILTLPAVAETYTGNTDIWGGTLNFDGQLKNSALWLNHFTKLNSNGGQFRSIKMTYASELRPGGENTIGSITTDTLRLGFGSRLVLDINDQLQADAVNAGVLTIETKSWTYGPSYLTPVVEFVNSGDTLREGTYVLGIISKVSGSIANLKIEGLPTSKKAYLQLTDNQLSLVVEGIRDAAAVIWNGAAGNTWNLASAENFTLASDTTDTNEVFVTGDKVLFDDSASSFDVTLTDDMEADSVIVDNTTAYTFSGTGSLNGGTTLVKRGSGRLTISTDNTYTGGTRISGGTLRVSALSNATQSYGGLGGVNTTANKFIIENGAELNTTASVTQGSPMQILTTEGGTINNTSDFVVNKAISGTTLTKKGSGWMKLNASNSSLNRLVISAGTVFVTTDNNIVPAKTVEIAGGTLSDADGSGSYSNYTYNVEVPENKTGTWNLDSRATYKNKLTGSGTLTVNVQTSIQRTQLQGDWSAFTGTIKTATSSGAVFPFDNSYGLPDATLNIADGQTVCNTSGKTFAIGKVTGNGSLGGVVLYSSGTVSGTCTWKIGNDENWSWAGKATGSCNIVKTGAGKVTLTNKESNDYTGYTRVDEGELHISSGVTLGTGALTVSRGATLSGITANTGNLINSATTINGTLQVGVTESSTSGTLNFNNKNVTFGANSVLRLGVRRGATASSTGGTSIQNINRLTMNGTVSLSISDTHTLAVGDSVILWKATTTTGTPKLESEVIDADAGLYWDTSRLAEGILFVTDVVPTGITGVTADSEVHVEVIAANGIVMDRYTSPFGEAVSRFRQSTLPQGTYVLRMSSRNGSTTKKVSK